ncbi:heavy metal translocating P-type ATPase [Enterococcus sp.]|uniref:heavy metal translocating P-type ATPase n=1 Tax=Enterococcus sp. TaxID=35783 RepID=UPI0025C51566|nr:heavy metal translocating P-type ATPase [Enterococcus sp.]
MSTHSCNHSSQHAHSSGAAHQHAHGNAPLRNYLAGVVLFIVALMVPQVLIKDLLYSGAILLSGYHIIWEGIEDTVNDSRKSRKFRPNVHLLMTLAAFGSVLIGNFNEAALLILIFAGAHFLEDYAEGQSRKEITNLLKLNPTEARLVMADGSIKQVPAEQVKKGDTLQVLPGDQIATDGRILSGISSINEASINGESIPREKTVGDEVFGSTINGTGTFMMEVTKDSSETVFAKILSVVESAQTNQSKTETRIKKIEPIYVTTVLILVPLFILTAPFLFGWDWSTSFYRGLVMMISASPCALAASAVPASLSAISNLAKRGILFKGSSYLANMGQTKVAAFDKTGTLTMGKPQVTDVYFDEQASEQQRQEWASLILAMEKQANHPLAAAIVSHFEKQTGVQAISLTANNEIGSGLTTVVAGKAYRIGKPSGTLQSTFTKQKESLEQAGKTVVLFSVDEQPVGLIALMDLPNPQAKGVIDELKQAGIRTVMITGDSQAAGEAIGEQLGVDQVAANVLPENKAQIIQQLQQEFGQTVMVGDGINDAPALVQSDIGFAMGEGSDVAIEVGDAVIMKNDLTRFTYALKTAKKLDRIIWQNIFFSMFIVALLIVLNLLGKMNIGLGVFAHEGSTLLVLFNGLRMLAPLHQDKESTK